MKKSHLRLVVCLLLVFCVVMPADAANKSRLGTAGATELLVPIGARGIGLGGSSMVFASGSEAMYWNPAGLSRMQLGVEAVVSHMTYIADLGVTYGGIGLQAGEFGTLGFALKTISFGDIPVTTENFPDGTGENYSPTFLTISAAYSKLLTDRISVGLTANVISERIMSTSATGIAFTIGLQYYNLGFEGLNLGVAVKNIGPNMTFAGSNLQRQSTTSGALRGTQPALVQAASFELPSSMEIGVGYSRRFDEQNYAMVGALFRNNNYQDDEYSFGAEYSFDNLVFVRGGYTISPQVAKDAAGARGYIFDYAVGGGLHYNAGGMDLTFDYAYQHVKYFSGNNVISLKIGF